MHRFFQTLTFGFVTFLLSATGAYSADVASWSFFDGLIEPPNIQPAAYHEQMSLSPSIEVFNPPIEMNLYFTDSCTDLFTKGGN